MLGLFRPRPAGDEAFEAPLQGCARQHHIMAAGRALQPYIRAQAVDAPLEAPARVRLAQPHDIVDAKLNDFSHMPLRIVYQGSQQPEGRHPSGTP